MFVVGVLMLCVGDELIASMPEFKASVVVFVVSVLFIFFASPSACSVLLFFVLVVFARLVVLMGC